MTMYAMTTNPVLAPRAGNIAGTVTQRGWKGTGRISLIQLENLLLLTMGVTVENIAKKALLDTQLELRVFSRKLSA